MSDTYPYPTFEKDGYDFEVVEQSDCQDHPCLRHPVPEARFAVQPGDLVKLIFRYRYPCEKNGQSFTAEHQWVVVTEIGGDSMAGRLDNNPQFTTLLKADAIVPFPPKHIVQLWRMPKP